MKKNNLLFVLTVTTMGVFFTGQIAQADDSKNTEASVTVNPGELKIKSVDSIQFDAITLNGNDQDVVEKEGTKAKIAIEDFRGSNSKGWTLKAKLREGDFNGLGLTFAPIINVNVDAAVAVPETTNLNTQDTLIASVADDKIMTTEFDTEIQLNPQLNIPAKTKANVYSTTIIWNLAATPETK